MYNMDQLISTKLLQCWRFVTIVTTMSCIENLSDGNNIHVDQNKQKKWHERQTLHFWERWHKKKMDGVS